MLASLGAAHRAAHHAVRALAQGLLDLAAARQFFADFRLRVEQLEQDLKLFEFIL